MALPRTTTPVPLGISSRTTRRKSSSFSSLPPNTSRSMFARFSSSVSAGAVVSSSFVAILRSHRPGHLPGLSSVLRTVLVSDTRRAGAAFLSPSHALALRRTWASVPRVELRSAAVLHLPGEVESNSPAVREGLGGQGECGNAGRRPGDGFQRRLFSCKLSVHAVRHHRPVHRHERYRLRRRLPG